MKKFLFTIACLLFTIHFSCAQKVEVKEAGNALSTVVYEKELSDVMKEWRSVMKKNDGKVETEGKNVIAKTAVIKSMSGGTYDVRASFEEIKKGEVKMDVVFDPVITATSSAPTRERYMSEGKGLIKSFAVDQTKDGIEALLKLEKKNLSKMKDQQEDLVKRKEKLVNEIEQDKDEIKKDEDEIKHNIEAQKTKATEIETQGKAVDAVQKRLGGVE